jgi:hydroxylamine reductase
MFCYQCEQAAQRTGCTSMGVCGKDPETAALQDLLIHAVKGISVYAHRAAKVGLRDAQLDSFTIDALFATVTNVNFSPKRMQLLLEQAAVMKEKARVLYETALCQKLFAAESLNGATCWEPAALLNDLIRQGEQVGIEARLEGDGADITGLIEMLVYGIKGMAAYAHHSWLMGQTDDSVAAFIYEVMDYLESGQRDVEKLLGYCMQCGTVNFKVMELLDRGHTSHLGHPEPTSVRMDPIPGKCILVSGHDLGDLEALLQQTEGKGINIYTHGEMLPAHGYPQLKKYPHLVGNYGGAWQDQAREFDAFPGAILMTTNCIQKPKQSYISRIFTCGLVAFPGVSHVKGREFAPVIEASLSETGFLSSGPGKTTFVGFGHHAILGVADKVIEAVKAGAIQRFFVIGGCDGARPGRNYYTEFVEQLPKDTVILTLGCAKFRFNSLELGTIGGIPRLLDCGQCNDSFSAIRVALALAEAFKCGVNELPLTLNISWYEQKAVAVLLTLLSLGVKNIRLGPTLPAFATPFIIEVLQSKFGIQGIGSAENDISLDLKMNLTN